MFAGMQRDTDRLLTAQTQLVCPLQTDRGMGDVERNRRTHEQGQALEMSAISSGSWVLPPPRQLWEANFQL